MTEGFLFFAIYGLGAGVATGIMMYIEPDGPDDMAVWTILLWPIMLPALSVAFGVKWLLKRVFG